MKDLLNATQIIKRLKKDNKVKMDAGYFSRKVTEGYIPSHAKEGSTKRFFFYDEVVEAIEDMKDPSRDAQRETIKERRESKERSVYLEKLRAYVYDNPIQPDFFTDELKGKATTEIDTAELETECIAAIEVNMSLINAQKAIFELLEELKEAGDFKPYSDYNNELTTLAIKRIFIKESYTEEGILDSFNY